MAAAGGREPFREGGGGAAIAKLENFQDLVRRLNDCRAEDRETFFDQLNTSDLIRCIRDQVDLKTVLQLLPDASRLKFVDRLTKGHLQSYLVSFTGFASTDGNTFFHFLSLLNACVSDEVRFAVLNKLGVDRVRDIFNSQERGFFSFIDMEPGWELNRQIKFKGIFTDENKANLFIAKMNGEAVEGKSFLMGGLKP